MTARETVAVDFAALLRVLGYTGDEFVALLYRDATGQRHTAVAAPTDAIVYVQRLRADVDVFFGVNPTRGPVRKNAGRGTEADITRLAGLWCDLDVKPGGCPSLDVAEAIIATLSIILDTRPSVIVESGHGLHAYWPISDGHIGDGNIGAARALIRRFGRLVAVVADTLGAGVDNVYELARMLRVPGTFNNKTMGNGAKPIPVVARADIGGPLTMAEVDERLTEVGICEVDDDREAAREEISPPARWAWAENTCGYVATMIDNWAGDTPTGRNPWLCSQEVRLACAHRLGCVTEADYRRGRDVLQRRHRQLLDTAEPRRKLKRFEFADAHKLGLRRAAEKTDKQASAELAGHSHAATEQHDTVEAGENLAADGHADRYIVTLIPANDIVSDIPDWVWEHEDLGRIQLGVLTLFAGRPGAGKSTAARWFAAQFSKGALDGCWKNKPQKIAYIASEESLQHVVKPGLQLAGADMNNIVFPEVTFNSEAVALMSDRDEAELTKQLKTQGVTAIFVDPIMATIRSKVDIYRNNELREALAPWVRIAKRINGTVVGIVHLIKGNSGDIVASVNGSSAFGEVARCVFGFAKDPQNKGERVMSQVKNACGVEDLSLEFEIAVHLFTADSRRKGLMAVFSITGDSDTTAEEILSTPGGKLRPAMQAVLDFVKDRNETGAQAVVDAGLAKNNNTASKMLERLFKRGYIDNPTYGYYCPKGPKGVPVAKIDTHK
jgi:hypothetical protein